MTPFGLLGAADADAFAVALADEEVFRAHGAATAGIGVPELDLCEVWFGRDCDAA